MSEITTRTGVVLRSISFADKEVDDALGLQMLSVRITREGLRALEISAARHGMPLMAFVRKSLEAQTGIPLGLSSDLQMPTEASADENLEWPTIEGP